MKQIIWTLLGLSLVPQIVLAQTADSTKNPGGQSDSGSATGYIVLAALVVIVIIYVLLKKQYRKFNE